jgi:amino acid transporter
MIMQSRDFFTRKASGLVRQLSASDVLMFNILSMGIVWTFLYIVYGPLLYPGVNMPVTVIIAAFPVFLVALTFLFFSVAMPRSGGDFVWVSRSIHPAIAFMNNFLLGVIMLSFMGPVGGWFLDPGITSIMIDWGTLTNNPTLIAQAHSLVNANNLSIFALIVVLVAVGVNFLGTKNIWRFQWGCFLFVIVGTVLFIVAMLAAGHDTFVSRFNQLSGTSYDAIVRAAQESGYNTGFTSTALLFGTVYAFLNFFGFQWSAYVGGEVKDVSRSQVVAILGSVAVFGAFCFMSFETSYIVGGSEFVHAAAFLSLTGNSAWTLPMPAWSNYLIVFATDNPWVAALVGFSVIASVFGSLTTIVVMVTRLIFAWSFDRIIPAAFSSVDQRFRVPRNALALVAGISLIYVYLTYFTTVMSFLSYSILGMWISTGIIGLAAMVFPYRRRDIFEKSPKMVQTKVGGVPAMSILGAITLLTGAFVSIGTIAPQYTGAPVNPYYVLAILLTMGIGLLIYGIAYWYNRRIGIDMGVGFREIPPA